jgi:transcriptional regulator with XRE-family HTH domain
VAKERPEDFVRRTTRLIAETRRARGFTQETFAEALGTATRNVRRIEAGQNLTLFTLARIATVLGVAPRDLLPEPADAPAKASPAASPQIAAESGQRRNARSRSEERQPKRRLRSSRK